MKKSILAAIVVALGMTHSQAQQTTFLENIALEAGYGYSLPFISEDGQKGADYAGINSLHLAAHYSINNLWGVRGSYGYNSFSHKDYSDYKLNLHKLVAEATFNITEAMNPSLTHTADFNVYAHAGAGLAMGISDQYEGNDYMGVLQIGLQPMYRFVDNWSVFIDASYQQLIKQNFNYAGFSSAENSSGFLNIHIGVNYRFDN